MGRSELAMIQIQKILAPTDFSEAAKKALRYATALAKVYGAEVLVLNVVEETAYPVENVMRHGHFPNLRDEVKKGCQRNLDELLEAEAEAEPEVPMRGVVVEGKPYAEVIATAREEDVDLIVIATRGHTGLKHALLGSTAERVVREAPCPVLTVREKERDFVSE